MLADMFCVFYLIYFLLFILQLFVIAKTGELVGRKEHPLTVHVTPRTQGNIVKLVSSNMIVQGEGIKQSLKYLCNMWYM